MDHSDAVSQAKLLKAHGPSIFTEGLAYRSGYSAFIVTSGDIIYPYRTRDDVAVVRHTQSFGVDVLSSCPIFGRHGVPVYVNPLSDELPAWLSVRIARDEDIPTVRKDEIMKWLILQ